MSLAMTLPLMIAASAASGLYADLDAIDRQVAMFTGAPAGMTGGGAPVDRRLRLNRCRAPLALGWRSERRETVVVDCPGQGGWRLFVPVQGTAPGMAAAPAINRGDAVTMAVSGDGFAVSQPGEALESGAVGAWIRVRPANAPRAAASTTLRAQVIRPGLVSLPLP